MVTFSTVGYGDFAPSSDLSRLLVFALALLAMGVFSTLLDLVGEWRVRIFDKMPQERQILAVLAAQIGGGAAVLAAVDGLSLQDSMLLALQTVSTVGYGELRPRSELGKVVTMGLVLSSVSTFGWVTSCIGDAIHPDSDTSIGLGGTVGHWGFSSIDRFLGRAHGKTAASFSLSSSSEHRAMLLVKAAALLFLSAVAASAANGLPLLDAFYWTVMTVSTVGYGDVTLSSWGKWIEIFLLVFGLGLFSSFTDIAAETLRRPLERNFGNSARPPALLAGILVVQAVAFSVVEEIPLPDGLYLALCTISTIGYGDIHPRSALGKLLACAFTIASVSIAGATLSAIGDHLQAPLATASLPPPAPPLHASKIRDRANFLARAIPAPLSVSELGRTCCAFSPGPTRVMKLRVAPQAAALRSSRKRKRGPGVHVG